VITNFKELATTPLREKALKIINAAYDGIDIKKLTTERICLIGDELHILENKYNLKEYFRVFIVGFGKGSADLAFSLGKILSWRLSDGIVLDVRKPAIPWFETIPNIEFLVGSHPLPSSKNIAAATKIEKLVDNLTRRDLLIVLICGGGSILSCSSFQEMSDLIFTDEILTRAAAPIEKINLVRKHFGLFKGGNLAHLAYPAKVVSLIVNDVPSEDLSLVASGLTFKDLSTKKDAATILMDYGLNPFRFNLLETPKDDMFFSNVDNLLFSSNRDAVSLMKKEAVNEEFKVKVETLNLTGEAKDSLSKIYSSINSGEAIIASGETTVKIKKYFGKGGRNQEAVLGFLKSIKNTGEKNFLVASFTSDARDNSEAAGAIGDEEVLKKSAKLNLSLKTFLDDHDSFDFFSRTGDLLYASDSSFNVSDLMLLLKE